MDHDRPTQQTPTGASEAVIERERDAWILMAARWPEALPAVMADKVAQLANPKIVRVYQLIGRIAENGEDEELLRETADLMSELFEQAAASGELDWPDEHMSDAAVIRLMDSFADASHPAVARLRELIAERGWTGWTRVQKREPEGGTPGRRPAAPAPPSHGTYSSNGFCRAGSAGSVLVAAGGSALRSSDR